MKIFYIFSLGNGTIIGASANIVAISVARQYGYRITFFDFFKCVKLLYR